jgi:hypothetical protein
VTTMSVTLGDSVEYTDDVLFKEIDGEAVLLHLDIGEYFTLDPVGTRIWALIRERGGQVGAVLDGVLAEFDVTPEVAQRDLLALLEQLITAKLVRVAGRTIT